jgi:hypothetical protein
MRKRELMLNARIPNFNKDSEAWRRGIHAAVAAVQARTKVRYTADDKLDVEIRLHLGNPKLTILDLDNRLKDIFDALQGCIGEKGKSGELKCIIPNDDQIYRVVVEKRLAPKVNRSAESTIRIRRYDNHKSTARHPRDRRKHVRETIES